MTNPRAPRFPLGLEVQYRTAGSFLVSYSANLSTGGMFLETAEPRPVGTELQLRFTVPGEEPITLSAVVAWIRQAPQGDLPAGMGLRFVEPLDARYGERIDAIVSRFRGLRIVVFAGEARERSRLASEVQSMIRTARVVQVGSPGEAENAFADDADVAVVEIDDEDPAIGLLILAKAQAQKPPIPTLVLTDDPELREQAARSGAKKVLAASPGYADLQDAVIRALGNPSRVG